MKQMKHKKLPTYLSITFAILFGTGSFILGILLDHQFFSQKKPWPVYIEFRWLVLLFYALLSLAASLFCYVLTRLAFFTHHFGDLIDERLYRVLHLYPHQLLADRLQANGHSVSEVLRDLIENYKAKRVMALEFAIESFRDLPKHGLIVFEGEVERYVEYIKKGITCSNAFIFASCRVRPFWFLLDAQLHPILRTYLMGPKKRGEHLKVFRNARKGTKIRLMTLSDDEIGIMLADALLECLSQNPPTPPRKAYTDMPEVEWFANTACKHPSKVRLFWARHTPRIDQLGLQDRMMFDGEVSLQFNFTDESAALGHTKLTWGEIIPQTLSEAVFRFVNDTKDMNEGAGLLTVGFLGEPAHVRFSDLLSAMDGNHTRAFGYVINTWNELGDDLKQSLDIITQPTSLRGTYDCLLTALNAGKVTYPDAGLTIRVLNNEGEPVDFSCDWKTNSKNILKL